MTTLAIQKVNESFVKLITDDDSLHRELYELFSFMAAGATHTPLYKSGQWDGYIRLYKAKTKLLPQGLVPKLVKWCKNNNIKVLNDGVHVPDESIGLEVQSFIDSLNITVKNEPIKMRDYQEGAVHHIIKNQKALLLSPTSSGKSLIIYVAMRFLQQAYGSQSKLLLLVPNKSLVEQMYADFSDYSKQEEWNVEENMQKISGDYDKKLVMPIVVSTWQTMMRYTKTQPGYFNQFSAIFVDEAHLAKGKSITDILESANKVQYKVGLTGTLSGAHVDEMCLTGLMSEPYVVTTTKELMDAGQVADLTIKMIGLEYSDDMKRMVKSMNPKGKVKYADEIDFLCTLGKRNEFIAKLAKACKGNTLILVNRVDLHGKLLLAELQKLMEGTGRNVHYIDGSIKANIREEIRHTLETEVDSITIATYQTMSTGVSIKNLNNIMFASPSKSVVRVLQSVGRGLRMSKTKTSCTLYDLFDDMVNSKSPANKNHTYLHAAERIKLYTEQEFKHKITMVPFG